MLPTEFMSLIITVLITGGITGIISTVTTVIALRVHLKYLIESIERHEKAIARAHDRIDNLRHALPGIPS